MKFLIQYGRIRWKRRDLNMMVIMFLVQFILLCPEGLTHTSVISCIRILQTAMFVIALGIVALRYLNDKFVWVNLAFFITLTLATIRADFNLSTLMLYISRSIGVVVFYYFASQINYLLLWRCLSDYFATIALINTILTLISPDGLFLETSVNNIEVSYYLLGNSNQVIPFYIIGIAVSIIYYKLTGKKRGRGLFLYLQALVCNLIYGSATSLIMLFVFVVLSLFLYKNKALIHWKKWIAFVGVVGTFVCYYAILVLNIQVFFAGIIENVLHKDVTLSTRVIIWNEAFRLIQNSPLLGYGTSTRRLITFGNTSFDAHNIVLQILLMGGMVLLVFLILIIWVAFKNWLNCKDSVRMIGLIMFITFAIGSLAEVYVFTYIFAILTIIYLLGQYRDNTCCKSHSIYMYDIQYDGKGYLRY